MLAILRVDVFYCTLKRTFMRQNLIHVTAKGTFVNVYFKRRTGVGNSNEKEAKSTEGGGGGGGKRTHEGKYQK